jgi:hypothetical protein
VNGLNTRSCRFKLLPWSDWRKEVTAAWVLASVELPWPVVALRDKR